MTMAAIKQFLRRLLKIADTLGVDPNLIGERVLPKIADNDRRKRAGETLHRYVSIGGVLDASRTEMVRALDMDGVYLETRSVRENPGLSTSLAGIVGKVGVDHEGRLGAEFAFDKPLAPEHGAMRFVHDARGRALWIESGGYDTPEHGEAVRLSIDAEIQRIAEEEAERAVEEMDAAGARVIIVDPMSGEILAMVDHIREVPGAVAMSTPRDQPGRRRVIKPDPKRDSDPALARNRNVEDAYEPGSTFKPFMWSAVTELGLAKIDEMVDTEGGLWRTSYGRRIEDVVPLDEQTWRDVLVHSSNIGMTKITDRMTDKQMQDAIRKYGFGSTLGLGLAGESPGLVTSPKNWSKYTRTSVSFGYEIAVTPVQIARAYCAFARPGDQAGTLPDLRLTALPAGEAPTAPVRRVLPAWTALQTRDAMGDVVANMDTRLIQAGILDAKPRYAMFGKSGTSRVADTAHGGYFERQYVSSFVAGAPADAPRIIVVAVVDDPGPHLVAKRMHYGSWVGGPIARRIIERVLPYLGVPPTFEDEQIASANDR
jgi:cell division protein FtsI (penicillin-binding protein 3)